MIVTDLIKAHLDVLLIIAFVCSAVAFVLRRMFGEQRSEKFAAFEQKNPRAAAAITLLDGGFVAVGMLVGAAIQLATGKPPPVLVVTPEPSSAKGADQ